MFIHHKIWDISVSSPEEEVSYDTEEKIVFIFGVVRHNFHSSLDKTELAYHLNNYCYSLINRWRFRCSLVHAI